MNNNDERDEQYNRKFTAEADSAGLNSAGLNSYMEENGAGLGMHYSSDWRTSEYSWLATEPLYARLLDTHQVLVYDETHTYAAILDTEDTTDILTVNNNIINWHQHYRRLRNILTVMRSSPHRNNAAVHYYPNNPMLAPGQHENNVVNKLDCGHELDTEFQLTPGTVQQCSQHGFTKVSQP